jgi:type IV pilus assembly protein PilM
LRGKSGGKCHTVLLGNADIIEAIRELLRKSGVRGGDAVLGISGHSSVVVKRISMPMMTEDELGISIKYEAEQYIPFDVNDVNMDFQILGPKQGEEGKMDVVLVAVKRHIIEDCVDVVSRAGLHPVIVDVDSFALSNMYEINYDYCKGCCICVEECPRGAISLEGKK